MFTVTNTSDETKRFKEFDPAGGFRQIQLEPGESGDFDIDPAQAVFVRGGLKTKPARAARAAPTTKPTKTKAKAQPANTNVTGPSGASSAE